MPIRLPIKEWAIFDSSNYKKTKNRYETSDFKKNIFLKINKNEK
ncbi:MAG: hypothetical protein ACI4VE_02220 [Clostridia bacterium]